MPRIGNGAGTATALKRSYQLRFERKRLFALPHRKALSVPNESMLLFALLCIQLWRKNSQLHLIVPPWNIID